MFGLLEAFSCGQLQRSPPGFKLNTVQRKGYDSEVGAGRALWEAVADRIQLFQAANIQPSTATLAAIESHGFWKASDRPTPTGPGSVSRSADGYLWKALLDQRRADLASPRSCPYQALLGRPAARDFQWPADEE
jgi:hypothetical protein